MPSYTVTVATGTQWFAGTDDYIYLTLVGSESCSEKTLLDKPLYNDFERGAVDSYDVTVANDLGEIQLIKIEKRKYWMSDDWYCKYITLKTPKGDYIEFPCYRWIIDEKEIVLRDGRARLARDDVNAVAKQHRYKELVQRQKNYRWKEWYPGFPMSIDAEAYRDLPRDIQFDSEKGVDFVLNYTKAMENLYVNRFMHMFQSSWSDFADFEKIFVRISNTISEYVMQHWQEDFMFGYQFLNGCNPVMIKKCTELPENFPVTTEMVERSLERNLTLQEEIQEGNVYIANYELLDGVSANNTDPCTMQYIAAPICLLYKNTENKILPIAIQVLFYASFLINELLLPHVRFTIAINTKAREQLICECGLFDKANATGGGGHVQLVLRSMEELTYTSLCFPEAVKMKGLDSKEELPYYHYRDDGLAVWDAIKSFAADVVDIYYKDDETVESDIELQAFLKDVYVYGLRSNKSLGFPKSIKTRDKLAEYLTVVIFTASGQHAAVNFGQFDWCSWIPNAPPTMRCLPPTEKGSVTIEYIIESLPDRGRSCWHLGAVWALSQFQDNELFLGMYPDEHFIEKPVKEAMEKFRENLDKISSSISERNKNKKLPYYYLSPDRIPNSVAV
nr:PREDICTED: arachidonate 5-lipoxygenase [Latimeria chalumnae]|eukprot:XP_006009318.1 PREDICTED: arachidonate 5-lipoxygenase [Latimeria chalumnae]